MSISLSLRPDVQKFIEEKVRAGQYATPEDVVHEAIARLQSDEELAAEELDDETLAALEEADAQYDRGEFRDLNAVAEELRARFHKR